MTVDQYRKAFAKELRRGSTLFVHKTRKDVQGDPLHKPFLLDKRSAVKANAYKMELAGYGFIPVPTVATAPVGMTEAAPIAKEEIPKEFENVDELKKAEDQPVRKTRKSKKDAGDKA